MINEIAMLKKQQSIIYIYLTIFFILSLSGCSQEKSEPKIPDRWYTQSDIDLGSKQFLKHCSSCHGKNAEGTVDWRERLADGSFPPPPLNGTAHAWHHNMSTLLRTINNGGAPLGGKMPSFKEVLSNKEKLALIAYFQHFWTNEIYRSWLKRGKSK
jgi:mono/diheme cytochrome c family protein